ncbi:MAG: branched-chain amino acid ABC transporter permease [Myxococcota bacterium]
MPTRPLVTSYEQELRLFPDRWHHLGLVLGVGFLLLLPFVADDQWLTIGTLTCVAVVGSVSLMVVTGFAGQISLGHAAFLALGAYTAGICGSEWGLPFWVILPLAGLIAAGVGVGVGAFALRLKGLYLAIVTLGLVFLVNHVLLSFPDWTGGLSGKRVPLYVWFAPEGQVEWSIQQEYYLLGLDLTSERQMYFLFLVVAVLVTWMSKNLQRSGTGRAMMAVRDRDLAAAALGVDPSRTKVLAFGISSFFAGMAGAMFAWQQQYITIDPPFNLFLSVQYIAMIVLGGVGSVFGAVAGAVAFTVLTPLAEAVGPSLPLVSRLTTSQQSTVLFSVLVLVFLIFEPLGLFGVWLRIKRYFVAWPFRY